MNEMKKQSLSGSQKSQAGLSLIELMIALVLGLIVVSAVLNIYLGSSRSSNFSSGLRTMQESGRHGIEALRRGLRIAGYSPGVQFDAVDIATSSAASVSVRMVAGFDCNGADTTPVGGIAVNTYQFDAANRTITCRGNSATAIDMPLIEGVDGFSVLYGMDTDADDVPDTYSSWDAGLEASQIKALRIAFVASSIVPIRSRSVEEKFVVLEQEVTFNDRIARHVFSTTVLLRNGSAG